MTAGKLGGETRENGKAGPRGWAAEAEDGLQKVIFFIFFVVILFSFFQK